MYVIKIFIILTSIVVSIFTSKTVIHDFLTTGFGVMTLTLEISDTAIVYGEVCPNFVYPALASSFTKYKFLQQL